MRRRPEEMSPRTSVSATEGRIQGHEATLRLSKDGSIRRETGSAAGHVQELRRGLI